MAELSGSRVGRYRLLRLLGAGGMGSVWLAQDENLGIEVAIKQIEVSGDLGDGTRAQRISRARAEARNAAQLRGHPHVVNVVDIVEQDELPWIVMEYVTGASDLRAIIHDQGRLGDADIARVGIAVLKALSTGHSLGIVHRDVKPANILLAPDHSGNRFGRVMLADYGISLYAGSGQTRMTNGVIGTPGYMAPERARGAEPPASDLFSVGATLYCASEGHPPFGEVDVDGNGDSTATASLTEAPPWPANACGPLADVIMALLAKEPGHRPTLHTAITELAAVEAAARAEAAPPGSTDGSPTRKSLPQRSHRILAWGVAGALASTAIALTAVALSDDGKNTGPADSSARNAGRTAPAGTDAPAAEVGVLYGTDVGLRKPLEAGDCVIVGTHNEDYTVLTDVVTVDCVETESSPTPAGQVIATVPDAGDGETSVRQECGEQTADLRGSLADPVLTVLRPDDERGSATQAEAACLVFQRGILAGGNLGERREQGSSLYISQLSTGDCLNEEDDDIILADCTRPHDQQVIGHVKVSEEVPYENVSIYAICASRFAQEWVRNEQQQDVIGWSNSDDWGEGFRIVTCGLEGLESQLPAGTAVPKD
ncbi:protein kinase [Streptomyces sp. WMMC500]|uniref:serine/threonine-protein kinase n=1 Tax=Streptomyces sp. WMMC500 TaxID=3015154 RepID=UPI00248B0133|nr:serine/threonine-protein kinase [Streptomyces sp. WMMC500]WBB59271.1 protein kinase [Streptomyces sp. WMMC500]